MYLMYADESGNTGTDLDNKSQPHFVIAGILIKDTDWYDLNYMFQKRKIQICPDLASNEVHTTDIFSSSKSEKKGYDFRKYSLDEILNILEKLVDFIVEYKIPIIGAPLQKNGFKAYCNEILGPSFKIDPYLYNFVKLSNRYNNFIQLADICAFYINKFFCIRLNKLIKNEKKINHCLKMYMRLRPLMIDCCNNYIADDFFKQIKNEQEAISRDS